MRDGHDMWGEIGDCINRLDTKLTVAHIESTGKLRARRTTCEMFGKPNVFLVRRLVVESCRDEFMKWRTLRVECHTSLSFNNAS